MNSGELIAAHIFGSVGRGQQDGLSDLDVLAVVRNGSGKVPEDVVASHVSAELAPLKLSISWYGTDRLREMFRNGELFAWHLHRETIPVYDPGRFLAGLGVPAAYKDCLADVQSFRKVLAAIPTQIILNKGNAIYEAGLIYVCLRNIAMAASWVLCDVPDFSRYSPFNLDIVAPCPISVREFECAMHCRMAGQRGQDPPPGVDRRFVLDLFERLEPWIGDLHLTLQKNS
jgi:hypothetical protein